MRSRLFLPLMIVVLLALAACTTDQTDEVNPVADTETPTTVSTPLPPSRTPAPLITNTPSPPPLTVVAVRPDGPLPTATPVCPEAPSTRLIIGERGRVMEDDMRPLNVRSGPSTDFRILGRLEVLDVFAVLEGPECGGPYAWYLVERIDGGLRGWIAEGDPGQYYVEPYLPG